MTSIQNVLTCIILFLYLIVEMRIIFLSLCIGLALAYPFPHSKGLKSKNSEPYETKYISQFIDHFNFLGNAGPDGKYQQRYLISGIMQIYNYYLKIFTHLITTMLFSFLQILKNTCERGKRSF